MKSCDMTEWSNTRAGLSRGDSGDQITSHSHLTLRNVLEWTNCSLHRTEARLHLTGGDSEGGDGHRGDHHHHHHRGGEVQGGGPRVYARDIHVRL